MLRAGVPGFSDGFARWGGPSFPVLLYGNGGTFGHALDISAPCFPLVPVLPATPCAILEAERWRLETGR